MTRAIAYCFILHPNNGRSLFFPITLIVPPVQIRDYLTSKDMNEGAIALIMNEKTGIDSLKLP